MANNENPSSADLQLDRVVHEPARLKILAYLSVVKSADFVFLLLFVGRPHPDHHLHATAGPSLLRVGQLLEKDPVELGVIDLVLCISHGNVLTI